MKKTNSLNFCLCAYGRFFKHLLVIFLTQQMAGSIFRFIATTCRSMILANTGGSLVVLLLFLLGGFIVPRGQTSKDTMKLISINIHVLKIN